VIDTEWVLKQIVDMVLANLPGEIDLMNSTRTDFQLPQIPAEAFFFSALHRAAFNYEQFVVFGFSNAPTYASAQEDNAVKQIELFFEVVASDAGESFESNVVYKLLRYSKVLENVFLKNSDKAMQGYGRIQVSTLVPSTLYSGADGKPIRSAGVSVVAHITAR